MGVAHHSGKRCIAVRSRHQIQRHRAILLLRLSAGLPIPRPVRGMARAQQAQNGGLRVGLTLSEVGLIYPALPRCIAKDRL